MSVVYRSVVGAGALSNYFVLFSMLTMPLVAIMCAFTRARDAFLFMRIGLLESMAESLFNSDLLLVHGLGHRLQCFDVVGWHTHTCYESSMFSG